MPSAKNQIRVYADDSERAHLKVLAAQVGLSVSKLLLSLGMGYSMPKPEDLAAWQQVRDLMKVNADLARLGNLFKMALDERPDQAGNFERITAEIAKTQQTLKETAVAIRRQVQPHRK